MPLTLPVEVEAMLASGSFTAHSALDVVFGDGNVVHICTTEIEEIDTEEFGVVQYFDDLRSAGTLDESLDLSVDRVELTAQNVDGVLGGLAVGNEDALNGAEGILSHIFIDEDGNAFQVEVARGDIENADDQDPEIKFQLVEYLSSGGPVGGARPLTKHCANVYKKAGGGCLSTSALPDCDHTFDGPNGCDKHAPALVVINPVPANNQPRFAGFIFRNPPLDGAAITDPAGRMDGGNDFSSIDDYRGRVQIPLVY
jgi:hypothetical protein